MLERDYCLGWFLAALSLSDLKPVLGFKCGTALKRCYFGDYRFSEDLDFTLLEEISLDEILGRLDAVYRGVHYGSGITFVFDRQARLAYQVSHLPAFEVVFRAARRTLRQAKLP